MQSRKNKIVVPIIITILLVLYYIAYFGLIIFLLDGLWKYALFVVPLVFSVATIEVCTERIREITKGEDDDISQY